MAARIDRQINHLVNQGNETNARLARIEQLLVWVTRAQHKEVELLMATKTTDQAVIAAITENTSVTAATKAALEHYAATTDDLTKKLADALANADDADEPEVKAALEALQANNQTLKDAVPQVVAAVKANTPAANEPAA